MPPDPIGAALIVIDALDRLGVPYVIGGSFASSAHGFARATNDVDLVADLDLPRAEALVRALEQTFYVDEEAVRDAVRRRSCFNLVHLASLYKVDVFVPAAAPIARQQLARRRLESVLAEPERLAYVLTPEDVVLQKLEWYRAGGEVSERQWRDVLGVLRVQGERLDLSYLRALAATSGLTELLERALAVDEPV